MDQQFVERRRLLQFLALGSIAVPAVTLAGCAQGSGVPMTRPRRRGSGGNNGSEKSGGGGGAGAGGKKS